MKYNLQIELLDECNIEKIYISENGDINNIQLLISTDKNIVDLLSKSGILKMLKDMIDEYSNDPLMIEYYTQHINNIMNSDFNIIDNCESILILPNELVPSYIENNSFFQNKKIYLNEIYSANRTSLNKVKDLFGYNKNIYVKVKGNYNYISILDYEKTVNEIEKISSKIEKYDLSPLEQLIFAYDLVRDRVYVRESVDEDFTKSRDLTSVLLGDKIVCVGYANILDKVLLNIGFDSMMYHIFNNKNEYGHMRNIVHLVDEKYGIDGAFFLDTTRDRKKNYDDLSFLNSYEFFCRTMNDMDYYDQNKFYSLTFFGYDQKFIRNAQIIIKTKGLAGLSPSMIKTLNRISNFVDGKDIIDPLFNLSNQKNLHFAKNKIDIDYVLDRLKYYENIFFRSTLLPTVFLNALYKVRKLEYYENSEKYKFDLDSLKHMVLSNIKMTRDIFVMMSYYKSNNFEDVIKQNNIELDMQRVKLTKILKNIKK